ncbi:hypothetical protein BJV82DRAFT_625818 [Fennellomyces sp. T-0311]|nr:hypothetical protein BJV82DRAFT_625818 [Fennellomyces sp. T-0311]
MHFIELSVLLLALGSSCHAASLSNRRSLMQKNHLATRQDPAVIDACSLSSSAGESAMSNVLNHFTGLFSDSLYTYDTHFPGPVAAGVEINLLGSGEVTIGKDHPSVCSSQHDTNVYSYGLVTRGSIVATNPSKVTVYGNVLYGADIDGPLQEDDASCLLDHGIGLFNFTALHANLQAASDYLGRMQPDFRFDATGAVTALSNPTHHPEYHVFTLDTCSSTSSYVPTNGACAAFYQGFLSDPSGMLFGDNQWAGIDTSLLDSSRTIVINIPIRNEGDLQIFTNIPSQGLPSCRTIFNFFTVDEVGDHVISEASFQVHRGGDGVFEGLFLAPNGRITADFGAAFSGKMFAGRFDNSNNFGEFTCGGYEGCFPIGQRDISEPLEEEEPCSTTTVTLTTDYSTTTEIDQTVIVSDISTVTSTHMVSTGETTEHTTGDPTTIIETVTTTATFTSGTSEPTTTTATITGHTTVWVPVADKWPPKV